MAKPLKDLFIQAYDDHSDAIFRHCYFRVFERERAKELTQEVFIKTWEYLRNGQEVKNLRAFLYRVANNLVIDESRKKKTNSLDAMQELGFDPKDDTHNRLLNFVEGGEMIRLLNHLEPKHREAISMRYLDDMDIQEIAAALGETENNVSVRLHRGLEKIRKIYNENVQI
ncbi:MAG: RNA polymerase sigma factor [Patescibacteria group bacterium]